MGIDEAGRGPVKNLDFINNIKIYFFIFQVLGPMVYGCCLWPISAKDQLKKLGFADSK